VLAVLGLHDVKYRDPNGIIFDISAHGCGGAVKDVGFWERIDSTAITQQQIPGGQP